MAGSGRGRGARAGKSSWPALRKGRSDACQANRFSRIHAIWYFANFSD
ncbi:hypothetical protein [Azospirillum largimobile]